MKDHRFIELVNFYIDRQITAAETAELEAEIQGNPRRRAVYRQYCQMHRATTLVYDSFRGAAEAGQPAADSAPRTTIELFENRRRDRRYRWAYYASGLAAAACLALVFARLNSKPATDALTVAAVTATRPAVAVAATTPIVQPDSATAQEMVPLTVGPVSLRNVTESDYTALLTAMRQEEQRNQSGRMPSLFEDGVFESQQVLPAAYQRTFRSRQTPAQQAEFTAFQFQR